MDSVGQGFAVHVLLNEKILRALTNHSLSQVRVFGNDQENNGDVRRGSLQVKGSYPHWPGERYQPGDRAAIPPPLSRCGRTGYRYGSSYSVAAVLDFGEDIVEEQHVFRFGFYEQHAKGHGD